MDLRPVTYQDALAVASNMRESDRREIFAGRWNDDPEELAADCLCFGSFGWIACEPHPIAVVGAAPLHPGVWSVYMFAGNDFLKIKLSLTKFVKRVMIPSLVEVGAHRAECHSIDGHVEAHRWLEFLGATRESTRRRFGRNGEDFHCYVWLR